MGTKNAIVNDVADGDIAALKTAITDNSGTFGQLQKGVRNNKPCQDLTADFLTDADGAAFAVDVASIGAGYTDIVWDLHPLIGMRHGNM